MTQDRLGISLFHAEYLQTLPVVIVLLSALPWALASLRTSPSIAATLSPVRLAWRCRRSRRWLLGGSCRGSRRLSGSHWLRGSRGSRACRTARVSECWDRVAGAGRVAASVCATAGVDGVVAESPRARCACGRLTGGGRLGGGGGAHGGAAGGRGTAWWLALDGGGRADVTPFDVREGGLQ